MATRNERILTGPNVKDSKVVENTASLFRSERLLTEPVQPTNYKEKHKESTLAQALGPSRIIHWEEISSIRFLRLVYYKIILYLL